MGFFHNNPVIEFFHRITRKPSSIIMWIFTGLIVSSTIVSIWSLPAIPDGKRRKTRDLKDRRSK
ncbi:hypothetical protein KDRO_F08100 [Kluyveromyces lactis]|nr:hypothetical protein KDRO_F08100 [Kluyveromyces lactis]